MPKFAKTRPMAITNYTELKASVADWLNRADLTSVIPDFITLAEARFNRTIRTRDMIKRQQTTTTNEFVPVPLDWLETYQLELPPDSTGQPYPPLQYIGPNEAAVLQAKNITGNVRYYTTVDGLFELIPKPQGTDSVTLTCAYYAKIPALSDTQTTNWLLTKAPDLYLYTALANAAPYLNNDERVGTWASLASTAADELKMDSERAMRSQTTLNARRRGFY